MNLLWEPNMLKKFIKDTSGNFAIIFAISLLMLMAGVGAAIDLNAMVKKRSSYQNMADAAVLAAARSGETKRNKLRKVAKDFVAANNFRGDNIKVKAVLSREGRLRVSLEGTYKMSFMGMFGKPEAGIEVVAEAPLAASEPVNIALVLDATFSMSGTKMTPLTAAASSLVTTLAAFDSDNLKMSVIPFSQYVNVGMANRPAIWLDVPDDYVEILPEVCRMRRPVIGTDSSNCTTVNYPARPAVPPGTCYNDGVPYSCGGRAASPAGSYQSCPRIYGPPVQTCYIPTRTYTWRGCVGSRTEPLNKRANYANNKIPGLMNISCGTEIRPLTNTLNDVKTTIAALNANGETYMPAGLLWGWRSLTREQPLIEAKAKYSRNTRNVLILMTDGANTKSKSGVTHTGHDATAANTLTKTLCRKIKADNVEVYTIAYAFGDVTAKNILRRCATDNGKFFDARNSAELKEAFDAIGKSLLNLRLTH